MTRTRAGFVQVMRGRVSDPARARELARQDPDAWVRFRPDILGSLMLSHDDGEYVMAIYFTSEAEAREGEKTEPPAELAATHAGDGCPRGRRGHLLRPARPVAAVAVVGGGGSGGSRRGTRVRAWAVAR